MVFCVTRANSTASSPINPIEPPGIGPIPQTYVRGAVSSHGHFGMLGKAEGASEDNLIDSVPPVRRQSTT